MPNEISSSGHARAGLMQLLLPFDTAISPFDEWRGLVSQLLPAPAAHTAPSNGAAWIVGAEPPEVIVRITSSDLTVYTYVAGGDGPRGSSLDRNNRVGSVGWPQLPRDEALNLTARLVAHARQIRREGYRICRSCGEEVPPEMMDDARTRCRACAGDEWTLTAPDVREPRRRAAAARAPRPRSKTNTSRRSRR